MTGYCASSMKHVNELCAKHEPLVVTQAVYIVSFVL